MRRIDAEFAPPRRPRPWMWVAVALVWVAAGLLLSNAWRTREAVRSIEAMRADAMHKMSRLPAAEQPERRLAPYADSASVMLKEREFAWPEVLRALEQTSTDGVVVSEVSAVASDGRITVTLLARDHSQALTYVKSLNAAPRVPGVVWFELERMSANGTAAGVLMVLRATRVP